MIASPWQAPNPLARCARIAADCVRNIEPYAGQVLNVLADKKVAGLQNQDAFVRRTATVNLLCAISTEHSRPENDHIERQPTVVDRLGQRIADVTANDIERKRRLLHFYLSTN